MRERRKNKTILFITLHLSYSWNLGSCSASFSSFFALFSLRSTALKKSKGKEEKGRRNTPLTTTLSFPGDEVELGVMKDEEKDK